MRAGLTSIILLCVYAVFFSMPLAAGMIMDPMKERMTVFYTQSQKEGWNAMLRGLVVSISTRQVIDTNDISQAIRENSSITIRLYSGDTVLEGDELFVVNDRNLIIARMKVAVVFKSITFDTMAIGYGNFKFAHDGDRVVQRVQELHGHTSYLFKSRGDYFTATGDEGNAISEYKKALDLDGNNPSARLELGYVYLKQGLVQFASKEFEIGYKNIGRIYDNEDRYRLFRGLVHVRFEEVYNTGVPEKLKKKFREEGISFAHEALKIYPESVEVNYMLGYFNYRTPNPSDTKARDYFLKVVELDPEHVDAYVCLSELYLKHKNKEKSRSYAEKALQCDPSNVKVRELLKILKGINK